MLPIFNIPKIVNNLDSEEAFVRFLQATRVAILPQQGLNKLSKLEYTDALKWLKKELLRAGPNRLIEDKAGWLGWNLWNLASISQGVLFSPRYLEVFKAVGTSYNKEGYPSYYHTGSFWEEDDNLEQYWFRALFNPKTKYFVYAANSIVYIPDGMDFGDRYKIQLLRDELSKIENVLNDLGYQYDTISSVKAKGRFKGLPFEAFVKIPLDEDGDFDYRAHFTEDHEEGLVFPIEPFRKGAEIYEQYPGIPRFYPPIVVLLSMLRVRYETIMRALLGLERIDVTIAEWRDTANGNTYHKVKVVIKFKRDYSPTTIVRVSAVDAGYENQWEETTRDLIWDIMPPDYYRFFRGTGQVIATKIAVKSMDRLKSTWKNI
jgi:hypothetical protein